MPRIAALLMLRRHAAFGCWQGNGINLAMLSTARHENSPAPAQ